jgi:DNA mismatch repair protein MutS
MASMGDSVVSVMSTVVPSDPAQRTFRVVRAPADGLAHAMALAEKHGVTYDRIKERLAR